MQTSVVALSPDGMTLAMSGYDGWLRLWDLERLKPLASVNISAGSVHSLAFDPDGRALEQSQSSLNPREKPTTRLVSPGIQATLG